LDQDGVVVRLYVSTYDAFIEPGLATTLTLGKASNACDCVERLYGHRPAEEEKDCLPSYESGRNDIGAKPPETVMFTLLNYEDAAGGVVTARISAVCIQGRVVEEARSLYQTVSRTGSVFAWSLARYPGINASLSRGTSPVDARLSERRSALQLEFFWCMDDKWSDQAVTVRQKFTRCQMPTSRRKGLYYVRNATVVSGTTCPAATIIVTASGRGSASSCKAGTTTTVTITKDGPSATATIPSATIFMHRH
jgi:hypothetical protein